MNNIHILHQISILSLFFFQNRFTTLGPGRGQARFGEMMEKIHVGQKSDGPGAGQVLR